VALYSLCCSIAHPHRLFRHLLPLQGLHLCGVVDQNAVRYCCCRHCLLVCMNVAYDSQPVELFTKYGRRGRIKETVGTKGGSTARTTPALLQAQELYYNCITVV